MLPTLGTYFKGFAISSAVASLIVALLWLLMLLYGFNDPDGRAFEAALASRAASIIATLKAGFSGVLIAGMLFGVSAPIVVVWAAVPFLIALWKAASVRATHRGFYVRAGIAAGVAPFALLALLWALFGLSNALMSGRWYSAQVLATFFGWTILIGMVFAALGALGGLTYWTYAQSRPPISQWSAN